MTLKLSNEPAEDFVEYHRFYKKIYGMIVIIIFSLILTSAVLYLIFLRKLSLFEGTYVSLVLGHIKIHIFTYTFLGLFYVCLFGGLFFLFTPIEAFYIAALTKGSITPYHMGFMFLGLLISYSLNYLIGLRFSKASKNLISPKKFYRTKILVNRFGKFAILFFNLIGAGSQQITFVLGVFRYNKTRLFVFSMIGQLLKYAIITASVLGFF